jgi:hypothetical protein
LRAALLGACGTGEGGCGGQDGRGAEPKWHLLNERSL